MLDNTQLKAVEQFGQSSLLLAGPGCGKTHILAHRVFHANTVHGVPFEGMLCLTFTNRAAREMNLRVRQYLGYSPEGLFVGNLHSFCYRFLHINHLITPDTSIFDEDDVDEYLTNTLGLSGFGYLKDFMDAAMYVYQLENDHPESVMRRPRHHLKEADYERIETYVAFKEENRLIDFNDILLRTYTALLNDNSADLKCTGYTWLMVDEVQDMTPLQLAIIDALCRRGRRTAMYLGDEQQAIFGFLGAGGRALDIVKKQCGSNIMRLNRNYRSPHYLVRLCNAIATKYLNIDPDFLPGAVNDSHIPGALMGWRADPAALQLMALAKARELLGRYPDESVAILVHTNREGDEMASLMERHGFEFFHVSRPDMFHQASFKTVWSHLAVVQCRTRTQQWARILYQTSSVRTLGQARKLMATLTKGAMSGDELMHLDSPTTIERFMAAVGDSSTIVVIDTETTGLDVERDEIIQIAAVKMCGGVKVPGSEFCVYINTGLEVPRYLGSSENPMYSIYMTAERVDACQALSAFASYIGEGAILAGHNVEFDMAMLRAAYSRCADISMPEALAIEASAVDTLSVSRLLLPRLHSHRLASLLAVLKIDGVNSHNAIDDVAATASLIEALKPMAALRIPVQAQIRRKPAIVDAGRRLAESYGPLYEATMLQWYNDVGTLTEAMQASYNYLLTYRYIKRIRHFDYFLKLLDNVVIDSSVETNLRTQADAHLAEITTFNESDLLSNGIIDERLSLMTIHKAKGLEMDNVIVMDATSRPTSHIDAARVMYVACSRARRRLFIGYREQDYGSLTHTVASHLDILPQKQVNAMVANERSQSLDSF